MHEIDVARRPRGRPRKPLPLPRFTIINLRGSKEQVEWLNAIHGDTHIPKSVIFRLALSDWAERRGYPPMPPMEDD